MARVSVLTAVHNGELYLDAAIASIITQSYDDFEYLLVDDGSTDQSPTILASWAERDARIRLLHNPRPLNPAGALNRALVEARGDYVAILDHDDLAFPTRLAEQVAYLDAHPEIGVVGAQAMAIDAEGTPGKPLAFPTAPTLLHWRIFFHTPLLHSAAMMRRSLVEQVGGYSTALWAATDYELFARMSHITQISNLSTTLASYRHSPQQVSTVHRQKQMGQVLLFLQSWILTTYGFDKRRLPAITALFSGVRGRQLQDEEGLAAAGALLGELYQAYIAKSVLSSEDRRLIADDCAWHFLLMAYNHRHSFRRQSRQLFQCSLELDPIILTRAKTRAKLREMHKARGN